MKPHPLVDFLGNEIEVHDVYLYGSPITIGRVIKIRQKSIMIETGYDKWTRGNGTMNCKSPDKGVCLNKADWRAHQ